MFADTQHIVFAKVINRMLITLGLINFINPIGGASLEQQGID